MSYYRLYFMNPGNGHIVRFADFDAADDEAATAIAAGHCGSEPLELWCRHRKVIRFEPGSAPSPPSLKAAE